MANEWNIAYPLDHTTIGGLPGAIKTLKDSCKDQIDREHETPVDGDATGGEHSSGSGVAYEGTSTPATRPDGATALADNAIDRGRLWIDGNKTQLTLKRWSGSAWVTVGMSPSAYAADESIIFPNGLILKHGYATISATSGTVTFDAAFPTAVVSCSLTLKHTGGTLNTMTVTDFTTVDIDWVILDAGMTGFYWQAWGY
jgi:hypothetical protein